MPEFHSVADVQRHFEQNGVPRPLPLAVREAYTIAGIEVPSVKQQVVIAIVPTSGICPLDGVVSESNPLGVACLSFGTEHSHCVHCGTVVPLGQHQAAHAVAGAEHAVHPETQAPLRLRVDHCSSCHQSEACDREATTPGSGGAPGNPMGFCEFVEV